MQIGCHGSVWTGSFDSAGLAKAIAGTASAGFDLIEIPLMDPDGLNVAEARKLLTDHGLGVTASLGLTPATDVSSESTDVVAAGEHHLNRCLEVLSDLGGTHLVGVIYSSMQKYMDPATPLGRRHSQDVIGRLAARGKKLGVVVGIEVVNRYESNLINTARQALRFLDEPLDAGKDERAVVHLDTYHMNIEEPDMASPVLDVGDRLGYVHIGESNRGTSAQEQWTSTRSSRLCSASVTTGPSCSNRSRPRSSTPSSAGCSACGATCGMTRRI